MANPGSGLALVADGMGGHAAGEIASQLAASTVNSWVSDHAATGEEIAEMLRLAAQEANARVFEAQRQDRNWQAWGAR